jgi:hypothetical protein
MMHNVDTQRKTHVQCSYVRELEKSAKRKKKNISSLSYYGENGYIMKYLRETAQTAFRAFSEPAMTRGCKEGRSRIWATIGESDPSSQSAMISTARSISIFHQRNKL